MLAAKTSALEVFKLIDIDQSGSIDFEEFSIFFAKALSAANIPRRGFDCGFVLIRDAWPIFVW